MTRPIHTVKYMKAQYRKYQLIALTCALFTVAAALLAALSGLQMSKLQKAQAQAKIDASNSPSSEKVLNAWMEKEIENLRAILNKTQEDLAKEKENSTEQQETISSLKRQLSALSTKARSLEEAVSKPVPPSDDTGQRTIPSQPATASPTATEGAQAAPATGEAPVTPVPPREASTPTIQQPLIPQPQPAPSTPQQSLPPKEVPQSDPAQKPSGNLSAPQSQIPAALGQATSNTPVTAPPIPKSGVDHPPGQMTSASANQLPEEAPKIITEEPLSPSKQQ